MGDRGSKSKDSLLVCEFTNPVTLPKGQAIHVSDRLPQPHGSEEVWTIKIAKKQNVRLRLSQSR